MVYILPIYNFAKLLFGNLKIKNNEGLKINEKQAYASCGQSLLMKNFIEIFEKESIKVSQILLTFSDTEERKTI